MRRTLTAFALVFAATAPAGAETIAFTHTGSGMGTLNGVAFARTSFVIHATADTSAIEAFANGFRVTHQLATIDILGLGTFDFLSGTNSFVNRASEVVGFGRTGPVQSARSLIIGPYSPTWATWDMTTSVGPVVGLGSMGPWSDQFGAVVTSGGVLFFAEEDPMDFSFTAVIPSPSVGAALGIAALAASRRRTRA